MSKVLDRETKIRCAGEERELWERHAAAAGLPLQNFIRMVMNAACDREDLTRAIKRARAVARKVRGRNARAARTGQ